MKKSHFLSSAVSIFRTAQVIWRMDKGNLPAFVGNRFLVTIQPFVALYFSARILNALWEEAAMENLIILVALAVGCNYGVYLLERLTAAWHGVEGIVLYWQLYNEMSKTMMRADYKEVEGTKLHLQKDRIERASNIYWCGPWEVPGVLMNLAEGITTIMVAIAMAYPVFLPGKEEGIPWGLIAMGLLIIGTIVYSIYSEKQLYNQREAYLDDLAKGYRNCDYYKEYIDIKKAAKDVRLYQQQNLIQRELDKNEAFLQGLSEQRSRMQAKSFGVRGALSQACGCVAYFIVGARALAGVFAVGSVVQYVGAISRLTEGIRMFVYAMQHIKMQGPHCQEYLDLIGYENEVYCGNEAVGSGPYEITFEHVSFRYPGQEEWVLRDLTITLRPDEHLAVVGMNGSGKTTFIKLLCRLYDPTEGVILLNGIDIREYRYEDYLRLFSVVFQDFQLFALPVAENVAAGDSYDAEKVLQSLETAGIRARIERMPKGIGQPIYQTQKDGVTISGGEAQKLAIARALYKDAPFVVLDEPTAALDPLAEFEIYSSFHQLVKGKTAIYISHRLSSCRFCDRIAVFEQGRLIQKGNHEKLVAETDGAYYKLWNAQAQYYQST